MYSPKVQKALSTAAGAVGKKSRVAACNTSASCAFPSTTYPDSEKSQKSIASSLKCCTAAMFQTPVESPNKFQFRPRRASFHPHDMMSSRFETSIYQPVTMAELEPPKVKTTRRTSIGNFIQKIKQNDILSSNASRSKQTESHQTTNSTKSHFSSVQEVEKCSKPGQQEKKMYKTQRSISVSSRGRLFFNSAKQPKTASPKLSLPSLSSRPESGEKLASKKKMSKSTEDLMDEMEKGFTHVLASKSALSMFHQFLKKEFSEENLEFWMNVEQYREMEDSNERREKAQQIYETYVSECGLKQVNMDARLHSDIREKIAADCSKSLFNEAQSATYKLMERDSYRRFLETFQ